MVAGDSALLRPPPPAHSRRVLHPTRSPYPPAGRGAGEEGRVGLQRQLAVAAQEAPLQQVD